MVHPPLDERHRAFCTGAFEAKRPETHFKRNRNIVDACEVLLATPMLMVEQEKGGTWYTINFARKKKRHTVIFWPDGSVTEENAPTDPVDTLTVEDTIRT